MPVLKSPEVHTTPYLSGLKVFKQKANPDVADYDTDVGLTGFLGLNPICNSIHLYTLPVGSNGNPHIEMSLFLSDAWDGKDHFISAMNEEHKIPVQEKPQPWGSPLTQITVRGADNIQALGKCLRVTFETTAHVGADILRPLVHPTLLGEVLDAVDGIVAESRKVKPNPWQNAALDYGWRS